MPCPYRAQAPRVSPCSDARAKRVPGGCVWVLSMDVQLSSEEYDRTLPRKRVAAGVLFFDVEGRVLLVDPVYL